MSTPDALTTAQMRKAKDPARLGISRTLRRAVGGPDESAPKRVGRPTDYDPFMVAEAAGMAQMGATDAEICAAVGITHDTFYRWVKIVPGFSDAIKRGEAINDRVERSLLQRALGGTKKSITTDGEKRVEKIEDVAPDTTAQIFWLKNRRRDRWADRQEHELVVPIDDGASPEELDTRRLALAALALFSEAEEQPLTLDAVASYDQPTEAEDGDQQDDWAGEPEDLDL